MKKKEEEEAEEEVKVKGKENKRRRRRKRKEEEKENLELDMHKRGVTNLRVMVRLTCSNNTRCLSLCNFSPVFLTLGFSLRQDFPKW